MANYGPFAWYLQGNTGFNPVDLGTSNSAANSATLTLTPVTVPAGALVVVVVNEAVTASAGTVSDGTNTYTLASSEAMGSATGVVQIFYSANVAALNAATITYTKNGGASTNKVSMAALYTAGVATSTPLDASFTAVANGITGAPTVTSGTPATNGEFVIGVVGWDGGSAITLTNVTPFASTPLTTVNAQNAASLGGGNLNANGNLAVTYAPTLSATISPWAAIVVGFKPVVTPIGWWNVAQWTASATPAAGTLNRQSATPVQGNERVFAVTVAGTNGGSEPAWTVTKGAKTTSNTTTYIEVTGQPAVNGDDAAAMTVATSASSAAGSTMLTFTSVPAGMSTRLFALNKTTAGVIPGRTTVLSFTSTTVTLSAAITGAGVGSGDTIAFSNTPAWQDINLGVATAVTLGYIIQDKTGAHLFVVTTAGNIGTTEPTWNTTTGATTTDSTTTWTCLGATGTYSAWSAPHARMATQATWLSNANASVYTADNHGETQSNAAIQIAPSLSVYFVCVDHTASVPPGPSNIKNTATVNQGGAFTLTAYASSCLLTIDGVIFNSPFGVNNQLITVGSTSIGSLYLKNCSIAKNGLTASSSAIQTTGQAVTFDNTTVKFGNTGDSLYNNSSAAFYWKNTPSAIQGSIIPTTLFSLQTNLSCLNVIDGVDFSALGAGNLVALSQGSGVYYFKNCKFGTGYVLYTGNTGIGTVYAVNCDSGATQYMQLEFNSLGSLVPSTSVIMTSGASDAVEGISWNITTTATATWLFPFVTYPAGMWNTTTGLPVPSYIRGIVNAATVPKSDQIWMEVEYFGSASSPLSSFANSTKNNYLGSGVVYTADTTAWDSQVAARQNTHAYVVGNTITVGSGQVWFCTTSGTTAGSQPGGYSAAPDGTSVTDGTAVFRAGCRFVMNVSVTPQLAGYIYVRIKAALPSTSYWVNPLIQAS